MIIDNLKAQWLGLRYRDQRAIMLMAAILIPLVVFSFIIQPMNHAMAQAKTLHTQRQALHNWMLDVGAEAKAKLRAPDAAKKPPITSEQQLSALMLKVASQTGLEVQKYERDNNGDIRIWLDDVRFDGLMRFVAQLSDNDVLPVSLNVDSGPTPGVVKARGVWSVQSQ